MKGWVTDIERFALNDGPGIRTTVFLKGCNMRCLWCHNPETISPRRELMYYPDKCIGCYKCVYACPCKAHKKIAGAAIYYPNLCIQCGKCAAVCYAGAMVMSGKLMTTEQVMKEVRQDKAYYLDSHGGVTISGGETLFQKEFAEELTDACHAEGIAVGIETNLSYPWEQIEGFINKLDIIMCDLKIFDDAEHQKWTGISNVVIKENIARLAQTGKPFIVRTPLVPGATDSDDNIRNIAQYLAEINTKGTMRYYELLNFNPLGAGKYKSLSTENVFEGARPLPEKRLDELFVIAQTQGVVMHRE